MSENKLINGTFTGTIKAEKVNVNAESQIDRVERKVDRVLELLEDKELSVSLDEKEVGRLIFKDVSKKYRRGE